RHRSAVRAALDHASHLDGGLSRADLGDLQPARLHHRHLGRRLREAATGAALDRHAAHLPWGSFYSVDMLPPFWQTVSLFNPVVYLISGFRWSFYGIADVDVVVSLAMTVVFMAVSLAIVAWIFKTGYKLKM